MEECAPMKCGRWHGIKQIGIPTMQKIEKIPRMMGKRDVRIAAAVQVGMKRIHLQGSDQMALDKLGV